MSGPTGFLSAEVAQRFSERIEKSLDEVPMDVDPDDHRDKLRDLLVRLGEMSFYEILGIAPGASNEEIHHAYTVMARQVHPSHAARLEMDGKEAALELLFERVTEAYLTLNDPDRSREYQMRRGDVGAGPAVINPEHRDQERKNEAARQFGIAQNMALDGRYFDAVQLLEQVVRIDGSNYEYFAFLGECESQNPNWVHRAVDSYEKAIELNPVDARIRAELGRLFENSRNAGRAREEYKAAIGIDRNYSDALAGLQRLQRPEPGATGPRVGWFKRTLLKLGLG